MNNLEIASQEVDKYTDQIMISPEDGSLWHFIGILIAPEDLYYELRGVGTENRKLLSFVGSLEGSWGYEPLVK